MNQSCQNQRRTAWTILTVSHTSHTLTHTLTHHTPSHTGDGEEDEDERMERKYPGLSRQYGRPSEELPPPLPPRPPDTLPPDYSPRPPDTLPPDYSDDSDDAYERPPPPPTTRPPGTHTLQEYNIATNMD